MNQGVILFIDKEKFYETLQSNTQPGVVNFVVDPAKKLTYEIIESHFKKKIFNENNLKIFHSINSKKILNIFLNRLCQYNVQNFDLLKDSAVHYIIYILYNHNAMGDPNHVVNEYNQVIKGLKVSLVLIIDKKIKK